MKTNCKHCQSPITVHSDTEICHEYECEACETSTCACGSTLHIQQQGTHALKIVCVSCDGLIQADFVKGIFGISDEALSQGAK